LTVLEPVLSRIEPIFSPRLWGARSLAPFFPDKTNLKEPLGEAWLTATDCRIANGPFAGKSLGESWHAMPAEWRGTHLGAYPDFPILVKFLFPNDKLSIQVHPDDAYAAQHEQAAGGRGKTEMWHVVSAQPGAELLFDLLPRVTKQDFLNAIADHSIESLFVHLPVQKGDTYFVPAGTQHALGPGMVVCEIQEYSDLTYRVYDFGRVDASGKPRELHIEKALEVTKFGGTGAGKIIPLPLHSPEATKYLLAACHFFATERWDCHRTIFIESDPQHFQVIVILEGAGKFLDSDEAFDYLPGQTWFLPASLPATMLHPSTRTSLMRIFVPDLDSFRRQLRNQGFDERSLSRVLVE
jgi:mannose-6-phosphate isomerase